jgi:hypothetical protein
MNPVCRTGAKPLTAYTAAPTVLIETGVLALSSTASEKTFIQAGSQHWQSRRPPWTGALGQTNLVEYRKSVADEAEGIHHEQILRE